MEKVICERCKKEKDIYNAKTFFLTAFKPEGIKKSAHFCIPCIEEIRGPFPDLEIHKITDWLRQNAREKVGDKFGISEEDTEKS